MATLRFALCALAMTVFIGSVPAQDRTPLQAKIAPEELELVKRAETARIHAIAGVYGSVVAIYGNDRQGGGSGVLFDPAGYALTNHHVVAAAGIEGWAGLADGKLYRWSLLGTDPGGDVAIIRLVGNDSFPVARLADSDSVRVGQWSMAMGNPFVLAEDQRPTVTLGIVSGIERFQPGDGLNMLVYGNCIQVDSSINPGNSGGPLFNMRGEVLGINGRGSFEERGRVNVGLGYAISANQVKQFIPDLLATKTAQHGTLDAQFGNRTGGVVCQSLNLNSPAAQAGLELGDRLISFAGRPITDANQFTNVLSTFPADYPCELRYARGEKEATIWVRLTPLPYDPKQLNPPAPPRGVPQPPGKKPDGEKPEEEPAPEEEEKVVEITSVPKLEPGKIRFADRNREVAAWLLQRAKREAGLESIRAVEYEANAVDHEGKNETKLRVAAAADGRFAVSLRSAPDRLSAAGYDGERFWRMEGEERTNDLPFEKAMRHPFAAHAASIAIVLAGRVPKSLGDAVLEGSDRAAAGPAARFAIGPLKQDPIYLWFELLDERGASRVRLVKSGVGIHDDEPIPAILHDRAPTGPLALVAHSTVSGLAERSRSAIKLTDESWKTSPEVPAADDPRFRMPSP